MDGVAYTHGAETTTRKVEKRSICEWPTSKTKEGARRSFGPLALRCLLSNLQAS